MKEYNKINKVDSEVWINFCKKLYQTMQQEKGYELQNNQNLGINT